MGPRGEVPIPRLQGDAVARGNTAGTAAKRVTPQEHAADVGNLAKQLTLVTSQLSALTARLEGAGVLSKAESTTADDQPAVAAPPGLAPSDRNSAQRMAGRWGCAIVFALGGYTASSAHTWWIACLSCVLPAAFGDGDVDSSDA